LRVRPWQVTDVPFLEQMFRASGFQYEFPDPGSPEFLANLVLVDADNIPRQAILMRLTAEMFLLQDKSWETPGMRLEAFSQIHEASRRVAEAAGVSDVHAWLPPEIDASFGRRLTNEFGWKKQLWPCFSREIQNG
jgi:hypothetical protein